METIKGGAPINSQIAREMLDTFADTAAPKGESAITRAKKDVLRLLVEGEPKKQIARQLDVSFQAVDTDFRNMDTKLEVQRRSGAAAKALRGRLL